MKDSSPKFLLTGGIYRQFAGLLAQGHRSKCAELALLDWSDKSYESLLTYRPSKDIAADVLPSVAFTASTLKGDKLYVCAQTEILIYQYPSLELLGSISHRYFNDLHHVTVFDDIIYVAATGIDAVLGFSPDGELVFSKDALGRKMWEERDEAVDYRKIASTKPHSSHPNFVFNLDGDIWVTRFEQKDAVNLSNQKDRIDIGVERPHDGHVVGDYVYFTTVNGCIVVANRFTRKVENIYNLNEIEARGMPLGWCRGLSVIGKYAFVGFTALRSTKFEKNIRWVRAATTGRDVPAEPLPTRVVKYNLESKTFEEEYVLPKNNIGFLFSILEAESP